MITLRCSRNQVLLPVRVTPKGGRDCVLPFQEGDTAIRLKVSAPPEDGKANAAVIKLLADALDIPKSRFSIVRGDKARDKQVAVAFELEPLLVKLAATLGIEQPEISFKWVSD
ncbi:MAG TPA: DUF167 domain-containing protein [Coleofasciculaceae cyanobacterium]|jgi:hypothetical protein